MASRLDAARQSLARAGQAAVERAHALRAQLAAHERACFEASHTMALESIRLRRASRPRVVMPVDAGPVGALQVYREPSSPVGKRAPAAPLDVGRFPRGILVLA